MGQALTSDKQSNKERNRETEFVNTNESSDNNHTWVSDVEAYIEASRNPRNSTSHVSLRNSTQSVSERRNSVTYDIKKSLRYQGESIHENMVNMYTDRSIRDDYDGLDNITSKNLLGQGLPRTWGTVVKIRRKTDSRKYACKVLKLSLDIKPERLHELRREITLLSKIDHSHIVKLKETYEDEGLYLYLVMELLGGHELFERLEEHRIYSEAKARHVMKQMVGAVGYLHRKGIVHRDLKLENFIYRSPDSEEIVLIDFGLSCRFNDELEDGLHQIVGSSYYMAPEVQHKQYDFKCDMWSLGVITYMLLSGTPPFSGNSDREIMNKAYKGRYRMDGGIWDRITLKAKAFIRSLLVKSLDQRLSAEEALKHPWLDDNNKDELGAALPQSVVQSLKKFATTEKFKRVALQAVAYSANYEDIEDLSMLFDEIDHDNDGYLSLADLETALMRRADIDTETVQKIFDAMDIDKQGKIHVTEFIAAAMNENHIRDENLLLQAFSRLDLDENGEIGRNDILDLLQEPLTEEELDEIFHHQPSITKTEFIRRMREKRIERTKSHLSAFSKSDRGSF